jgi:hypothetical protein
VPFDEEANWVYGFPPNRPSKLSTMKNQKQRNRAPRPFKNGNSGGRWGGNAGGGFIPAPNPTSKAPVKAKVKNVKSDEVTEEATPPPEASA